MTGFVPLQHEADGLGAGLPPLMVAADHLAASVSLGVHGRRKAGIGENFWQFRRFSQEDAPARIDWRQSARSQHLFVREREWEAAQTVWFWRQEGAGMDFSSHADVPAKAERANLLLLALASLLVRGGERVGLVGGGFSPGASRLALGRICYRLLEESGKKEKTGRDLPPEAPMARGSHFVWLGDFLDPGAAQAMERLAGAGIHGHLARIVDPAEEDFPYAGRARFQSMQGSTEALFGRAENVRQAYRARFAAHGETIARTATRLGWSMTTHRTDQAPLTALVALHAAIGGL